MAVSWVNILKAPLNTLTIGGIDVGGTYEQLEFAIDNTVQDIPTEDSLMAVDSFISARDATATVTLAEIMLTNLAIVWNLPTANIVSSSITVDQGDRGMLTWVAVGKAGSAPNYGVRIFNFAKSRVVGGVPTNLAKLDTAKLPVEFRFYSNRTTGIAGTITDSSQEYVLMNDTARSSTLPLDGTFFNETIYTAVRDMNISLIRIIYEENTSSDEGIFLLVGKRNDVEYDLSFYSTFLTQSSTLAGTVHHATIKGSRVLKANESLTVSNLGGKVGTGAVKVQVEIETIK
jgi:hypothetical protein